MTDLRTAFFADHAPGRGKLVTTIPGPLLDVGVTLSQTGNDLPPITTTYANDLIMVCLRHADGVNNQVNAVTSPNLTFTKRITHDAADGLRSNDIWTAPATTILTNEVISLTVPPAGSPLTLRGLIVAIRGINLTTIFDANGSLPAVANGVNGVGSPPTVTGVTTNNTSTYEALIAYVSTGNVSETPTGFTVLYDTGAADVVAYKIIYGAQSSITVAATTNDSFWTMIVDSLVIS